MAISSEVDLQKLRSEFAKAVYAEGKYERENAAKFRAVNQKVASYEEFRDIVKASHLQPLERKDIINGDRQQPWNVACSSNESDNDKFAEKLIGGCGSPSNAQELIRQWRKFKNNPEEQYRLLLSIPHENCSILKSQASASILGEILVVLNKCFSERNTDLVVLILKALAEIPNFKLSLKLLSKSEHEAVTNIFEQFFKDHSELKQCYSLID